MSELTFSTAELSQLRALSNEDISFLCVNGICVVGLVTQRQTLIFGPLDLSARVNSEREEEVIRLSVDCRPEESFKNKEWDILALDIGILTHALGRTNSNFIYRYICGWCF